MTHILSLWAEVWADKTSITSLSLKWTVPSKESEQWYICTLAIGISIITLFYDISINIIAFCKFFDGVVFFSFSFHYPLRSTRKRTWNVFLHCFTGPPLGGTLWKTCSVLLCVFEQPRVENVRGQFESNWSNWLKAALMIYNGFWKNLSIC